MDGANLTAVHLKDIEIEPRSGPLPDDVAAILADAARRIDEFDEDFPASIPAFVPSDFALVYRALASVQELRLATGRRFLEWGSGIGVVTCLAAQVGFDAVGIEIEPVLVEIAESLANEHGIDVQFACGSYVPDGAEPLVDILGEVTWLRTDRPDCYAELELEPEDFDLVFAYPWPGEEQVIFDLFAATAAVGTLLVSYHSQEGLRVQRKVKR
jgi:predicted O-methyltransferase YrrM